MSPEPSLKMDPPRFTECVPDGNNPPKPRDDPRQTARRLQELIDQIQSQANPAARALLQECLQTVLSLYGDGLARILEYVKGAGLDGQKILERVFRDSSISPLLLIHGLHPLDLETRLRQALDTVRPYMNSHGGNVELVRLENDFAWLRLHGTCRGCPSSSVTLELAVRRAIEEACPDLAGFEVEGANGAHSV